MNRRVLTHCILMSKENIVLWKIRCFAQNRKFYFVFSFKLFSIAAEVFPAEAYADKYFAVFPFQTFLLWNTGMTPSASRLPKQFSQLQEHLQNICLEVKIDLAPKDHFSYTFSTFPWPGVGGGLCLYRGACSGRRYTHTQNAPATWVKKRTHGVRG